MGDMLSQDEINALLGGTTTGDEDGSPQTEEAADTQDDVLSNEQKDILGEIGNISMGTAATTLFALLNQRVRINTPRVSVRSWKSMSGMYERPCVGVRVDFKEGLQGGNILVLKQKDVRIISNLMMGGDGNVGDDEPLTELDLSAIGEAMNQMVGSSSTSLSSLIERKIDIDTPHAFVLDFSDDTFFDTIGYGPDDVIVCISFRMEIDNLVDSEIMQILPIDFALDIVDVMKAHLSPSTPDPEPVPVSTPAPPPAPVYESPPPAPAYSQPYQQQPRPVNVQPAQFQNFDAGITAQQKENIDIIMDVPLEVSVELGRTRKKIKDILEFAPGTIIELDKLAGEPIDILVNGKFVAKGEVVVIDENFGIRVTDIINADKRI